MIQRKQTIYLLLAFICNLLLLFFPLFELEVTSSFGSKQSFSFGATGIEGGDDAAFYPVYILYMIMAILTALGIALFKNRARQLLVCRLNIIFHMLITVGLFTVYYAGKGVVMDRLQEKGFSNVEVYTGIGFYLVIAAIPFILLAIRGIRADEALLKSLDRLR